MSPKTYSLGSYWRSPIRGVHCTPLILGRVDTSEMINRTLLEKFHDFSNFPAFNKGVTFLAIYGLKGIEKNHAYIQLLKVTVIDSDSLIFHCSLIDYITTANITTFIIATTIPTIITKPRYYRNLQRHQNRPLKPPCLHQNIRIICQ